MRNSVKLETNYDATSDSEVQFGGGQNVTNFIYEYFARGSVKNSRMMALNSVKLARNYDTPRHSQL